MRDDGGRLLPSRKAISHLGERLWRNCREFAGREEKDRRSATIWMEHGDMQGEFLSVGGGRGMADWMKRNYLPRFAKWRSNPTLSA